MEKENKKEISDEWLKDLPIQTENIAYASDEMIVCAKCVRKSPPNRLKCLYCGAELELSTEQTDFVKPHLRKLEAWENGFNLIYQPDEEKIEIDNSGTISKMLRIDKDKLQSLLKTATSLPLARAESEKEAEIIRKHLEQNGIKTFVLSDQTLDGANPPKRLRRIEFFDDKLVLILFSRDEVAEIAFDDLALIVAGKIVEKKVEAFEKRTRKGEKQILDSSETAFDEPIVDIYTKQDAGGFRILQKGFDFSCLGDEKGILAGENVAKIIKKLRSVAPDAKFVNDYKKMRENLGNIWELEDRTESQGLRRKGIGKFASGKVTTANNLAQFTKYSRLQWHLL